jgi:hypothetical protein
MTRWRRDPYCILTPLDRPDGMTKWKELIEVHNKKIRCTSSMPVSTRRGKLEVILEKEISKIVKK